MVRNGARSPPDRAASPSRDVTGDRPPGRAGSRGGSGAAAHVLFDHVSFSYPGDRSPVLREVNLEVARGETLVLTGATGSGKTTLLYLVPRLADVSGGRVLLAGRDVRDIPLPRLRQRVACGFEEATLFSASVRENVTFGAADATDRRDRGGAASRRRPASCSSCRGGLTPGSASRAWRCPAASGSASRSPGRSCPGRRCSYSTTRLSALDVQTEERVTRALHEILAGVTALVVAHRPSTVALARPGGAARRRGDRGGGQPPRADGDRPGLRRPDDDGGGGPMTADVTTGTAESDQIERWQDTAGRARTRTRWTPGPGAGSRPSTPTTCPRRSRRCCGGAAGCCSAACCGRTGAA